MEMPKSQPIPLYSLAEFPGVYSNCSSQLKMNLLFMQPWFMARAHITYGALNTVSNLFSLVKLRQYEMTGRPWWNSLGSRFYSFEYPPNNVNKAALNTLNQCPWGCQTRGGMSVLVRCRYLLKLCAKIHWKRNHSANAQTLLYTLSQCRHVMSPDSRDLFIASPKFSVP